MKITQHFAGGFRDRPQPDQRERQQHELHPARAPPRVAAASGAAPSWAARARLPPGPLARARSAGGGGFSETPLTFSHHRQSMAERRRPPAEAASGRGTASGERSARQRAVRRRRRRRARAAHAARLPAGPARALRADVRGRQRRERRRRPRDHAEDRRADVRRRRRRDHARQPHLPPPRDLPVPRTADKPIVRPANFLRSQPGRGACMVERDGVPPRGGEPQRQPLPARRALGLQRGRGGAGGARARPTTCSSTCTPRRPRRRSRWAGTSTAA